MLAQTTKPIFGLDLMRAAAILLVLLRHANHLLSSDLAQSMNAFLPDGVSVFFVLSGFLIGRILLRAFQQRIGFNELKHFWIRRWFRTLPNYYLVLVGLIIYYVFIKHQFSFSLVKTYFIFAQNLNSPHPLFFQEAWSLCVEEWFYVLLPLLLMLLRALLKVELKNLIPIVFVFALIATLLYRYFQFNHLSLSNSNLWDMLFRKQVMTRLDALFTGVLGAYLLTYQPQLWDKYKVHLLALGLLSLAALQFCFLKSSYTTAFMFVPYFSLEAFAIACCLPYLSRLYSKPNSLIAAIVAYIARISYALYLLHFTIGLGIVQAIPLKESVTLKYSLYLLISVVLATLLYYLYERPTTRLREKFGRHEH